MMTILDSVVNHKYLEPVAWDVVKSAAHVRGMEMSYSQAYRVVAAAASSKWEQDKGSFEMIIPYLHKFADLNDESTIKYEKKSDPRAVAFIN